MNQTMETDVVIIGAGTAGMYALREVKRSGRSFLLIDHGPLGTVCARVGCMPSKVALHAAAQWQAASGLMRIGGSGMEALQLNHDATWNTVRKERDDFANPVAAKTREAAGEYLLEGRARFIRADRLHVDLNAGGSCGVKAKAIIIAVGSRPIIPDWLEPVRERVITTDELFELETMPQTMGILGLGVIGLEMGLALARLGIQVTGVDIAASIGGTEDPDISARVLERFSPEFEMWLETQIALNLGNNGLIMKTGDGRHVEVELLLASLGRRSNADRLGLADVGVEVDRNGVPHFDKQTMQVGDLPIFIAGDANNITLLMHEAADEGAIAGFNAAKLTEKPGVQPLRFVRKTPLSIAFTDPDLATVGASFSELDSERIVIGIAEGQGNGRSRVLHEPRSLLHIYADKTDGRLLGAAMVAARGEHMAQLLALAIERGETAVSLLEMPYYHPVVEEMLQSALQSVVSQLPSIPSLPLGLKAMSCESL